MNYRCAQDINDFRKIIELQNKNLLDQLNDLEKNDGFLSVEFSIKELQEMNHDGCIIICLDNKDCLCGYMVSSSIEMNKKFPLVSAMIDSFPKIIYKEESLVHYHSIIIGPVCIDKRYRGKGLLTNLIDKTNQFLQQKFNSLELLITFISSENSRSVNASKKADVEVIGQFEFNNKKFLILAKESYRRL